MLIQLTNLPTGITRDDVDELLHHMSIIKKITMVESGSLSNPFAWVELNCSQAGGNAICDLINGHYINGRHITAYAALYSH